MAKDLKFNINISADSKEVKKAFHEASGAINDFAAGGGQAFASLSARAKTSLAQIGRATLGVTKHADIKKEIDRAKAAYVGLKVSGKASLAELAQAHVALGKKVDRLKDKTNGWKQAFGDMREHATTLAVGVAALAMPAKLAIDFESAMADVRKVMDGTPEEMEALATSLQHLTREIPMTAIELAAIATAGGQLGIAGDDINQFVEITAKMATAFDMTAEDAGQAIGKLKNVFNLSVSEMEGFGDAINQLGNNTAAKEREIVEAMLRIGGVSEQFGIAKESAAALAATMISLGKPPEVAARSVMTLLNRMQTATMQSGDFQEALARVGMSADDMAAQVAADPQQALNDLLETLSKLEGQERAEVLTGLFGREFQDDIAVLVGSLDTYKAAMGQVADKTEYAGAMQKEFAARSDTTENGLKLLKNAVFELGENFGDGLLPAINLVAAGLAQILLPIADLVGTFPKVSAAIGVLVVGGLSFTALARVMSAARLMAVSLGVDMTGLSRILMASPKGFALLARSIGLVAAAFSAGWAIGTWLSQFDILKKAGISMAAGLTKAWLNAKKAWTYLTGGDTAAIEREIKQADEIYAKMFADVGRKAKETAQVQKKALSDVTNATVTAGEKEKTATAAKLAEMKKQYQAYTDSIKKLQDEIAGREKSLAEELRAMGRSGMSDLGAWKDLKKEAQEYERAAVSAAKAGNFDEAIKLADKAKSKYKELNREVKVGDKVLISQKDALSDAMNNVKRTGELSIDILKQQKTSAEDAAKALDNKADGALSDDLEKAAGLAKDYSTAIKEATDDGAVHWGMVWDSMRGDAKVAIDSTEQYVIKMTKDREIKVDAKLTSGAKRILEAFDDLPGVTVSVPGYKTGTVIPGYGGGDRHPAMLESGEGVLNKEAVRSLGPGFVHLLNSLKSRAGLALRERVANISLNLPELPSVTQSPAMATGGGMMRISLDFKQLAAKPVTVMASPASARELQRQFAEMERLSS